MNKNRIINELKDRSCNFCKYCGMSSHRLGVKEDEFCYFRANAPQEYSCVNFSEKIDIDIGITTYDLKVNKQRKLKVKWTKESEKDLKQLLYE